MDRGKSESESRHMGKGKALYYNDAMCRASLYPFFIVALSASFISCASTDFSHHEEYRILLYQEVPRLSTLALAPKDGQLGDYARKFRLALGDTITADQYLGHLPSGAFQLFVQVLIPKPDNPEKRKGTVYIFHGFATESSRYRTIARTLLEKGWSVVLTDLPGHGLSSGVQGGADDFSIYGNAVRSVFETTKAYLPGPHMAFGHSTGALAIMDYALTGGEGFSAVVLYAPLVRTIFKPVLSFVRFITRPMIKTIRTTSNTTLGVHTMPAAWYDALVKWEKKANQKEEIGLPPTLIIQGTKDTVVANSYNLCFIRSRCTVCSSILIKDATHYEPDSRTPNPEVIEALRNYFEEQYLLIHHGKTATGIDKPSEAKEDEKPAALDSR